MKHYIKYLTPLLIPIIISAQECEEGYVWIDNPSLMTYIGSNWWDGNHCFNQSDLDILQIIIDHNYETINYWDINDNEIIDPTELGMQRWENGNLTQLDCYLAETTEPGSPFLCNLTTIPPEISGLTSLIKLVIMFNPITSFTPEIFDINSLQELFMLNNYMNGELPEEFGSLPNLTHLLLSSNLMTGVIPNDIGSLTNLEYLLISYNQFTSEIPAEIINLENLILIDLSNNDFYGELPFSISGFSELIGIDLTNNNFTGEFEFGDQLLNNFNFFGIGNNSFSGEFPLNLEFVPNLERLQINNNFFTGPIPDEICQIEIDFSDSVNFNLEGNHFCSDVPNCIIPYLGYQYCSDILGDISMDDQINIVDIIYQVNFILALDFPTPYQVNNGDLNEDGIITILDIQLLVNVILE